MLDECFFDGVPKGLCELSDLCDSLVKGDDDCFFLVGGHGVLECVTGCSSLIFGSCPLDGFS